MKSSLEPVFDQVLRRNPGEAEFHQAVREVFDSLGPVLDKNPQYADAAVLQETEALSAGEAAEVVGTSRVSARRYLEYLADSALDERRTLHEGRAGRPEVRYRRR